MAEIATHLLTLALGVAIGAIGRWKYDKDLFDAFLDDIRRQTEETGQVLHGG